jgi:hypothetical protein
MEVMRLLALVPALAVSRAAFEAFAKVRPALVMSVMAVLRALYRQAAALFARVLQKSARERAMAPSVVSRSPAQRLRTAMRSVGMCAAHRLAAARWRRCAAPDRCRWAQVWEVVQVRVQMQPPAMTRAAVFVRAWSVPLWSVQVWSQVAAVLPHAAVSAPQAVPAPAASLAVKRPAVGPMWAVVRAAALAPLVVRLRALAAPARLVLLRRAQACLGLARLALQAAPDRMLPVSPRVPGPR